MRVLVIGGTGTVGGQVVADLLEKHQTVRVLTRDANKAGNLPQGAEAAIGDLGKPDTIREAMRGMDGVFMATALSLNETEEGLTAVREAQAAGVKRFVYMSVYGAAQTAHVPHCASKLPIEKALRESRLDWTILAPNHFYQNDLRSRDAILQGIYPEPLGEIGVNRVDVRDIAECAVNALTGSGHERRSYPLLGPEALTGSGTAAIYTRELGREVRYAGQNLEAWAEAARNALPKWLLDDLLAMYAHFQQHGLKAAAGEVAQTTRLLGHEPRRFEAFASETAAGWKGRTAAS